MITYNETKQARQHAVEINHYSIRLWIVLSLILSLVSIVLLSKQPLLDHRPLYMAALIVPIAFTLYFRNRIVLFGPFFSVSALVGMLAAAVCFGI